MDVCRRSHRLNCQTSTSSRSSRVIPYPVVQVRHNLTTLGNRLLIAPLCLSTPIPPFQLMYLQRLPTPITLYAHSQLATKVLPNFPWTPRPQIQHSLLPPWPSPWSSPIWNISFNLPHLLYKTSTHPSKIMSTVSCFSKLYQPEPRHVMRSLPSHLSVAHQELCSSLERTSIFISYCYLYTSLLLNANRTVPPSSLYSLYPIRSRNLTTT